MTSINPHYTFHYSQPNEYRYSHDSVFLARRAFEFLKDQNLGCYQVLDLCAGCGIVGLDFLFHLKNENAHMPKSFDFIEIQDIYKDHFEKNCLTLGKITTTLNFKNKNYASLINLSAKEQYNLILCNPPYFQMGEGKLSPSAFKNRCRFFLDSDFKTLIQGMENALMPGGQAFFILRNLQDHGRDMFKEAKLHLSMGSQIEDLGPLRSTHLLKIQKSYS